LDFSLTDIRCGQNRLSSVAVAKLGEKLESAKRYHDAAKIYLDVAEGKYGQRIQLSVDGVDNYLTCLFQGFAALAYKRGID
jgi:hypothetical protein